MFYDFFAKRRLVEGVTNLGKWNEKVFFDKQFTSISSRLAKGSAVLEIGPGLGSLSELFVKAGYEYQAIEANEAMQKMLARKGFKVQCRFVPPIPFADETFDFVHSTAVIEHMPTFERAFELLSESARVVRKGGLLGIGFPDYLRCGIDFYNWDYTHSFVTTERRIRLMLHDSGFKVLEVKRFSGSITACPLRLMVDLVMQIINSRITYFLAESLGLINLVYRIRKSFEAVTLIIAQENSASDK